MTLNNPIAFVFATVIPVIVALYLLRLKRKKKLVSSTFFWTEMVQDLQANVPFQKLRWNLLLLLQVLIALLIIFSLVNPSVIARLNEGQRTIFIIDTSASMSARSETGTRFDRAVRDISEYSGQLSDREQVMIIQAGKYAGIVLDFTDNTSSIERTLETLQTDDTTSDLRTAWSLALGEAEQADSPKIVVASDFAGIDPEIFTDTPFPVELLATGGEGRNAGIIDLSIPTVSTGDTVTTLQVFLAVRNYTADEIDIPVEIYAGDELVDVRSISVEADSRNSKIYNDVPYPGGVITAKLDIDDDLEVDNTAYAVPPTGENMELLLIGNDPFLTYAFAGLPGIDFYTAAESEYVSGTDNDLTIYSGWAPDEITPGNYLFFNPPDRDYIPMTMHERVESPRVTDWNEAHPIMRFVNPGSFDVFLATRIEPDDGTLVLLEGDSTPLMVYSERNFIRTLVFPFEIHESDIITRPTFPILMYNIASYFRTFADDAGTGLKTQGVEVMRLSALGDVAKLTGSDGSELEFDIESGHAYIDVSKAGIYELAVEGGPEQDSWPVVANFFNESEGDISGEVSIVEINPNESVVRFQVEGEKRIWKWLGILALFVLTFEWYYYHRKGF